MAKLKMAIALDAIEGSSESTERFDIGDISIAADLMVAAYRGTVDWDEGDDETIAAGEISSAIDGEYGVFVPEASLQVRHNDIVVSQIVCTVFEGQPLVVFVYTHPRQAGQGHATSLIRMAASEFRKLGHKELTLYVTENNPAVTLYTSLGFCVV